MNRKDKSLDLRHLAPITCDEERKIYVNILIDQIENRDIKNIGLTGGYASGKSSILKSLKEIYGYNKKILDISLAEFEDRNNGNNENDENNENKPESSEENKIQIDKKISNEKKLNKMRVEKLKLEEIEKKILQQMIYSVKNSELPKSNFKKIENFSTDYREIVIKILVYICSVLIIRDFKYYKNFLELFGLENNLTFKSTILFASYIGFLYLSFYFLKLVLKKLHHNKIEIKLKNNLFEVNERKKEQNIFNKYLDEIIYYFECTKKEIVIFEDLDRFKDSHKLFTKIRELNNLINSSEQIRHKVVFIYAVKDDIFYSESDRIKFFDIIIPVMPIISYSNSIKKIKEINDKLEKLKIDTEFLENISFYLNDLRLINNLFNEYVVYASQLDMESLSKEKLFSMIVYKNIEHSDYSKLLSRKGMLYELIKQKELRIEKICKNLRYFEKKIIDDVMDKEKIKINIQELRARKSYYESSLLNERLGNNSIILGMNDISIYLIKNGYINDDYYLYLSKEVNTKNKIFILKIRRGEEVDFKFKLDDCERVIKILNSDIKLEEEILNNDLIEFIIENNEKYKEIYSKIILGIKSQKRVREFIGQIVMKYVENLDFLDTKNEKFFFPIIFRYLYQYKEKGNETQLTKNEEEVYTYMILRYCSDYENDNVIDFTYDKIKSIFKKLGNKIDVILSNKKYNMDMKEALKVIKKCKIKIKNISFLREEPIIFKDIYENNFYEINRENIMEILNDKLNYDFLFIMKSNCKQLQNYICENLDFYIENLFFDSINIRISEYFKLLLIDNSLEDKVKKYFIEIFLKEENEELISCEELFEIIKFKNIENRYSYNIYKLLLKNRNKSKNLKMAEMLFLHETNDKMDEKIENLKIIKLKNDELDTLKDQIEDLRKELNNFVPNITKDIIQDLKKELIVIIDKRNELLGEIKNIEEEKNLISNDRRNFIDRIRILKSKLEFLNKKQENIKEKLEIDENKKDIAINGEEEVDNLKRKKMFYLLKEKYKKTIVEVRRELFDKMKQLEKVDLEIERNMNIDSKELKIRDELLITENQIKEKKRLLHENQKRMNYNRMVKNRFNELLEQEKEILNYISKI